MNYSNPPLLSGDSKQNTQALRDFLVRLVRELNQAETAVVATGSYQTVNGKKVFVNGSTSSSSSVTETVDLSPVYSNMKELRSLIVKTADDLGTNITNGDNAVMTYADQRVDSLTSLYVAKSDFGTYKQEIKSEIEATAAGVVESYGFQESINSVQSNVNLMQNYYSAINSEIRRGIIEDPDNPGSYVTGIAISQNLQFSGECGSSDPNNPQDGYTYYYLNSGQTFGLYTSTGWQFWIDGVKKGWFSSTDGMLHVSNIIVEKTLQIGDSWQLKASADGSEIEIAWVG